MHQTYQVVFLLFDGHLTAIFDATKLPQFLVLPIYTDTDIPESEKAARLSHIPDIMNLAEHYKWEQVRALYEEYLSRVEHGRRTWSSSVRDLQYDMLRSWDQLPAPNSKLKRKSEVYNNYNFSKNGCLRDSCVYEHTCKICSANNVSENKHRARDCPRSNGDAWRYLCIFQDHAVGSLGFDWLSRVLLNCLAPFSHNFTWTS